MRKINLGNEWHLLLEFLTTRHKTVGTDEHTWDMPRRWKVNNLWFFLLKASRFFFFLLAGFLVVRKRRTRKWPPWGCWNKEKENDRISQVYTILFLHLSIPACEEGKKKYRYSTWLFPLQLLILVFFIVPLKCVTSQPTMMHWFVFLGIVMKRATLWCNSLKKRRFQQ